MLYKVLYAPVGVLYMLVLLHSQTLLIQEPRDRNGNGTCDDHSCLST